MYKFPFTIMYFILSRLQVGFNPENLIVENKKINKFLFGDRIKKKTRLSAKDNNFL